MNPTSSIAAITLDAPPPADEPAANDADALAFAARRTYEALTVHLRGRQRASGALAGEVIWNPMLVSQYVLAMHILGQPIAADRQRRIRRSLELQVRDDGGWGMHPDSDSFLFHTVLAYVALRLLGHPPEDPLVAGAGRWIRDHGGVLGLPTWGRVWLALVGLYPWDGVQPILPEMWLLPEGSPFHPRRLYCHMRMIYLGLSYLYGARVVAPHAPVLEDIRAELYPGGYDRAEIERHRHTIATTDLYEAPGAGLRAAFAAMRALDRVSPGRVRARALSAAFDHILFEFRSTSYICLSPVNGLLFCLALWARDRRHPELPAAIEGLEYWVWEDEPEGMRIAGARSDIWDTSFTIQALCEGPRTPAADALVADACRWLPLAQLRVDIADGARHFRAPAAGGWGFADEHHPWPVSDCTAEAVLALLQAESLNLSPGTSLARERQLAALRFILHRQNEDGGFGSYEPRRGSMLLRHFNPAEIYGNCMLEYSYAECTASCIRGLAVVRDALGGGLPAGLGREIDGAIERGLACLLRAQDDNGGWAGFWGVHFTYGTFFVVEALRASGLDREHPALVRAVRWLCGAQRADGGWGESFRGNLDGRDIPIADGEASLVTQTSWALLALLEAAPSGHAEAQAAITRGVRFLCERHPGDGGFPREAAAGVFFNTAVLDYDLYRQTFPAWALARFLGGRAHADP